MRGRRAVCALAVFGLSTMPVVGQQSIAKKEGAGARRISTDHLELTTYTTEDVVAPGSLVSLVVNITPREGIHVYAPGAAGYKIVTLKLDPHPLLTPRPLQYPSSEIYFFKPLNEHVPVFQKPFTLTQPVALGGSREDRAALARVDGLTIKAALEYQACNDKVCFTPTSVPLAYSVKVRR
jgi:hypothetical protein